MNFLKTLTGSAILAGLLLGTGGCELIVAPDRTKIGEGGGGDGGAGGNTTTSTDTGGTGGTTTTSSTTVEECTPVDDNKECTDDVCEDGSPVSKPKSKGTACTQGGGAVCDDAGNCVQCNETADCNDNLKKCVNEQCVDVTCDDGIQNGTETGVDCGGSCAPALQCNDGVGCGVAADCKSGVCDPESNTCAAPACGDLVKNGSETDVDCGGSCAPANKCANGLGCLIGGDCQSGVCDPMAETCSAPACDDGVLNGDETDVDCGGSCAPNDLCNTGEGCLANTDCASGVCDEATGTCLAPVCGDGVTQTGEACDDGNQTNGDGCDDGPGGNCTVTACGNGVVTDDEDCDDGNLTLGDGCDDGPDGNCTESACGNGIVAGNETCDDANLTNGDGCDDGPGGNCTETGCGNGVVTGDEACDDGNTVDGDGCDSNCTISGCGNGILNDGEACDDGNTVNGDDCDNNCTFTACGNGIVTSGEVCDDGNDVDGDGCDNNCTVTACGNGVVTGTEVCDDGNNVNGDGCDNNCTVSACGNGVVGGSETCDDGNTVGGDCCSATCEIEPGCEIEPNNACGAQTALPAFSGTPLQTFGYGDINPAADLDFYSFTLPGPGIQSVRIETFFGAPGTCQSTATNDTAIQFRGTDCTTILATNDDGTGLGYCSLIDGTGVAAARNLTPGTYFVRVARSTLGSQVPLVDYGLRVRILSTCGNGVVEAPETCDDGDLDNGDGCSSTCGVEAGFFCQGTMPTVCAPPEINCSDGIDNNGAFGTDAADPSCQLPAYFPACGPGTQLLVYPNNAAFAIPDNNATGITSNVTVTGAGRIASVSVLYNITHTFDGDLDIFLNTPVPSSIDICTDNGGSGANFVNTVLNTACSTSVTAGTAPFTNCFIPESPAAVNALNGMSANGTWGLKIADDASGDVGTLNNWRLMLCTSTCGDGLMGGVEACDDGNTAPGDGCSATCTVETGYTCTGQGPGSCTDINECTAGTPCDTNATCTNTPGDFTCECDAGYDGTGVGAGSCTAICGDGLKLGAEACDDGNLLPDDGCSATCTVESGYTCTGQGPGSCTDINECTAGTPCDANATCDNTPGDFTCTCDAGFSGTGVGAGSCTPVCGDGMIVAGEACDDSNTDNMDGCDATCQIEDGWTCMNTPSDCSEICGDGLIVGDEECDDDETDDGDGCSAMCVVEAGFVCTGEPSVCVPE